MAQRLIVEGKDDAIVLSNILKRKQISPPKGYTNEFKFKQEFIINANGDSKIKTSLKEELQSPDVERIGIIIDADDKVPENRFKSLIDFIEKETDEDLSNAVLTPEGFFHQLKDERTIGIWVMPDNQNNGYLENFVGMMMEDSNLTWQFAQEKVAELLEKDFCKFTDTKKQKALVHTYLAWQETPGLPMGTAVKAGFINIENPLIESFANWFKNTFILEEK